MRYFGGCVAFAAIDRFHASEPSKIRSPLWQAAHDAFIALPELRPHDYEVAAQHRTRGNLDLPAHAVTAGWLPLPPSADLLSLWRRSDRTIWIVGWRLDDAGAAVALSSLGYLRHRQCAVDAAVGRAMVPAVALRPLARRQRVVGKIDAVSMLRCFAHRCSERNRNFSMSLL